MVPRAVVVSVAMVVVAACEQSSEPESVVEDALVAPLVVETAVAIPDPTAATTITTATPVTTITESDGTTTESPGTTTPSPTSTTVTATTPAHVTVPVTLNRGEVSTRTGVGGLSLHLFFVGGPEYSPGDPCTVRYIPNLIESATEVSVTIRGESPSEGTEEACNDLGYPRSVTVELSEPLGDRSVRVGGSIRAVVDGSTLAQPQWVPDGWQAGPEGHRYGTDPNELWYRTWAPPHRFTAVDCMSSETGVTLYEGAASVVEAMPRENNETVIDTHDVNGAVATYSTAVDPVTGDPGVARLAWVSADRGYMLWAGVMCFGDELPPIETMLRFARNLRT